MTCTNTVADMSCNVMTGVDPSSEVEDSSKWSTITALK